MPTYLSPGVYVEEVEASSRPIEGVGTAVAAFVGLATAGPFNKATLVTNWSQFTQTFGEFAEGSYLAHAVYGYFLNGGGACYVVRIGGNGAATPAARGELTAASGSSAPGSGAFKVEALAEGAEGNDISVEVADSGAEGAAEDAFKVVVKKGGQVAETFDNLTTKKGRQNVVTVVNQQSKLVRLEELGVAPDKVTRGTVALAGGGAPAPTHLAPDDYVGDPADRTGFGGLEAVDEITMVCVPDLMSAYQQRMIDLEGVQAVQLAMIAHCELMGDRIAILDPPPGLNAQQIKEWRVDKVGYDSKYACLYWPWVKVSTRERVPTPSFPRAGTWPASGAATTTTGGSTRPRPTKSCGGPSPSRSTSPKMSTICSTRSASTASGRSLAGGSGFGGPGRSRPTRRGAT